MNVWLALVVSAWAQSNPCLQSSVAPTYVNQLVTALSSANLASLSPTQGIALIWPIVQTVISPTFVDLYFGLSNGDTFNVKTCQGLEALYYSTYCGLGSSTYTPYVAYVASASTFHDNFRRVFPINSDGSLGSQVGQESSPYITTARPWYTQAASMANGGWTNIIVSATTGLDNHVYVKPFSSGGVSGVAAWDRNFREICDSCTMNSEVVPTVQLLSDYAMSSLCIGVTSLQGIIQCFRALVNAFNAGQRGDNGGVRIGLQNGDYYELVACALPTYSLTCQYTNQAFTAWVDNYAVYGDRVRRIYPMGADGTLYQDTELHITAGVTAPYDPRVRPWYTIGTGFCDPFLHANAIGYTAIAYSVGIIAPSAAYGIGTNGSYVAGVVSASVPPQEPCLGYVAPACH